MISPPCLVNMRGRKLYGWRLTPAARVPPDFQRTRTSTNWSLSKRIGAVGGIPSLTLVVAVEEPFPAIGVCSSWPCLEGFSDQRLPKRAQETSFYLWTSLESNLTLAFHISHSYPIPVQALSIPGFLLKDRHIGIFFVLALVFNMDREISRSIHHRPKGQPGHISSESSGVFLYSPTP